LTADDTRVVVAIAGDDPAGTVTTVTRAVVLDTATGAQVGTTITIPGGSNYGFIGLSADGSRAVITGEGFTWSVNNYVSAVAVVDTATGAQIGTTLSGLPGVGTGSMVSDDGTRAVITTADVFSAAGFTTATVIAIGQPDTTSV
jgi:hypothetical protein